MGDQSRGDKLSVILEDLAARFILTCPEEEFASFERLFFMIEAAHWFYVDHYLENDASLPSLGMKDFARRLFQACPMLIKFQNSVEEHLKGFSQYKVGVPVYGCIILDETLSKCLLVKSWGRNGTWTFPKGKINQDEAEAACAIREVWEEVGYDCSALLRDKDAITVTVNDHRMKLYIIPGVPESTSFVTQTVKEISKIEWFPVKDLPLSKSPGNNFFLVLPFARQLQEWIKCRKSGKPWAPPAPNNNTAASRSKRDATPSHAPPPPKEPKDARSASVPHQRPQQAQESASGAKGQKKAKQRRGSGSGAGLSEEGAGGGGAQIQILQREREGGAGTCRGNQEFGGGVRFDSAAVMAPLQFTD